MGEESSGPAEESQTQTIECGQCGEVLPNVEAAGCPLRRGPRGPAQVEQSPETPGQRWLVLLITRLIVTGERVPLQPDHDHADNRYVQQRRWPVQDQAIELTMNKKATDARYLLWENVVDGSPVQGRPPTWRFWEDLVWRNLRTNPGTVASLDALGRHHERRGPLHAFWERRDCPIPRPSGRASNQFRGDGTATVALQLVGNVRDTYAEIRSVSLVTFSTSPWQRPSRHNGQIVEGVNHIR